MCWAVSGEGGKRQGTSQKVSEMFRAFSRQGGKRRGQFKKFLNCFGQFLGTQERGEGSFKMFQTCFGQFPWRGEKRGKFQNVSEMFRAVFGGRKEVRKVSEMLRAFSGEGGTRREKFQKVSPLDTKP